MPEWPEDKLRYPSALLALRCFDIADVTREDCRAHRRCTSGAPARAAAAAGRLARRVARRASASRSRFEPLGPANLARATQLLNKTNQMNLTTRRLTEAELWRGRRGRAASLWTVNVSDRFGDAGLTGHRRASRSTATSVASSTTSSAAA